MPIRIVPGLCGLTMSRFVSGARSDDSIPVSGTAARGSSFDRRRGLRVGPSAAVAKRRKQVFGL
jgi:hypothetical protein